MTSLQQWTEERRAHHDRNAPIEAALVEATGLTVTQFDVLEASTGQRMNVVAEAARRSPSGLCRSVDSLVRSGLVDRVPTEDDRRGATLSRTPAGDAMLAKCRKVLRGAMA